MKGEKQLLIARVTATAVSPVVGSVQHRLGHQDLFHLLLARDVRTPSTQSPLVWMPPITTIMTMPLQNEDILEVDPVI